MAAHSTAEPLVSPKAASSARMKDGRLVSLDVLRGLAVAGMILVTDPGSYSAVYAQLLHAQWNGATATDMIFPAFLFAVGVAITLSFASRIERGYDRGRLARHAVMRSAVIFVIGLVLNGFPDYHLHTLRIPGVLQRIALCYLFAALIYLALENGRQPRVAAARSWTIAGIVLGILIGYWCVLKLVPVPGFGPNRLDSLGNAGAYIDRLVFGTQHMWVWGTTPGYGVTYDPEGLLSTLPAIATVLIGILAGEWMRSAHSRNRKALVLAAIGIVFTLGGWLLDPLLPINKRIWTTTFVLSSGGVSLLVFSVLYFVLDIRRWRWWATPALVFGTNAILAFALSNVITTVTDRIHVNTNGLTLHQWAYRDVFASWLQPVHASLAYAIFIVLVNMALVWPLYRRRILLRV
jgi:predicted acyltransferase